MKHGPYQISVGDVFDRLTVIAEAPKTRSGPRWQCQCACGNVRIVYAFHLPTGRSRSCGCLQRETAARGVTHGLSKSREYCTWSSMIERCINPRNASFKAYGGRGIRVCMEWQRSFAAFYQHIGPKPTAKHSIDRIDTNGNYEPGNVRWATREDQDATKRGNRYVEAFGLRKTIAGWSRIVGLSPVTISERLRRGMSCEDAVSIAPTRGSVVARTKFNRSAVATLKQGPAPQRRAA